jgi:dolichol-phosphate mannosyltransferase
MIGKRPLVFIPTYNEKDNVERITDEILGLGLELDLLFVDDNSSDGTGEILDGLARRHPELKVMHRSGKLGIGSAHRAGIRYAYEQGYQMLVTMDCDFTHSPRHIPELMAKVTEGYDVAVTSRYLQKNSLGDWNLYRKTLTHAGHLLTRSLLGLPYDATGAFRCYRLTSIPSYAFDLVASQGYAFFFESLYVLHRNGFRIAEIPAALPNRTYGSSKMDASEIKRSVELLVKTFVKARFNPEKFEIAAPLPEAVVDPSQKDEQGWEGYWETQKTKAGGLAYDAIGAFYRKHIIRRSLNFFVDKYFPPGAEVLHAGCGSGQVDVDIRERVNITGLDISVNALTFYKKTNKDRCKVLHGSIFQIPLPPASVDGIYNLGVMEHFTEEEIRKILAQFYRVLKPGGRMIIFWPPEFGASVLFFKGLGLVVKDLLGKKDVKFHPDEITRVRSRAHVTSLFESMGFTVLRYYFGPKDAFTYSVIVAEKPGEISPVALPDSPGGRVANQRSGRHG